MSSIMSKIRSFFTPAERPNDLTSICVSSWRDGNNREFSIVHVDCRCSVERLPLKEGERTDGCGLDTGRANEVSQ